MCDQMTDRFHIHHVRYDSSPFGSFTTLDERLSFTATHLILDASRSGSPVSDKVTMTWTVGKSIPVTQEATVEKYVSYGSSPLSLLLLISKIDSYYVYHPQTVEIKISNG